MRFHTKFTTSWLLLLCSSLLHVQLPGAAADEVKVEAENLTTGGPQGARPTKKGSVVEMGDGQYGSITGSVTLNPAGTYTATIRYSNGSGTDRPTLLRLGGDSKGEFPNKSTGSYNTFQESSMDVSVPDNGGSSLTMSLWTTSSNGGPHIDYIKFERKGGSSGVSGSTSGGTGSVSDASTSAGVQGATYDGEKHPWYIARVETSSQFDTDGAELLLDYDLHKDRGHGNVRVKLYDKECKDEAEGVTVTQNIVTHTNSAKKNDGLELLYLNIDIDTKNIYESNIWHFMYSDTKKENLSEGYIELCVYVELVEPSLSHRAVSTVRTKIQQYISLNSSYEVSGMGMTEIKDDLSISDASVNYKAKTCICDNVDKPRQCNNNPSPMQVNSMLRLCVFAEGDETEVFGIENLTMEQAEEGKSVKMSYSPIDKAKANVLTFATHATNNNDGMWWHIDTPVLLDFFKAKKPQPLAVKGSALLSFRTKRRLDQSADHSKSRHLIRARFVSELSSEATQTIAVTDGDGSTASNAGTAEFGMTVPLEGDSDSSAAGSTPNLGFVVSLLVCLAYFVV